MTWMGKLRTKASQVLKTEFTFLKKKNEANQVRQENNKTNTYRWKNGKKKYIKKKCNQDLFLEADLHN